MDSIPVDSNRQRSGDALRAAGINPYPYTFRATHHASDIRDNFDTLNGAQASIAGRVMQRRHLGAITFMDIQDWTGRVQALVKKGNLAGHSVTVLSNTAVGDIVGIHGTVTRSKTGEISMDASEITMLSKGLVSLPNKWEGLTDVDTRYRKRHLDLIMNPEALKNLQIRATVLRHVRETLDGRGALEVETPVLQEVYGGANARPFTTTYHTLGDAAVYLRISDELYLKRLIIGGVERVYEVSKDFRNEDADSTHNPEFTQIEYYEAYSDYNTFMEMMEGMLSSLAMKVHGSYRFEYQGRTLDFTPPFRRLYWVEELKKLTGVDVSEQMSDEEAAKINEREALGLERSTAYTVADALFDKYLKPTLDQPTFVLDYPAFMCPLTKVKRGNPKVAERFEVYTACMEMGNCYSELTDPVYQRRMFEAQEAERKKGDEEMPPSDEAFIEAIEYGMPPTAGIGIPIDRLSMIFADQASIKEVIAFPPMKPINTIARRETETASTEK